MIKFTGHITVVYTDKNDKVKSFHVQDISSNKKQAQRKFNNPNIKRIEYILEKVIRDVYTHKFTVYESQEEIADFAKRWNLYF